MVKHGKPEILDPGKGCHYISGISTHYLEEEGIHISMEGKGSALADVRINRF